MNARFKKHVAWILVVVGLVVMALVVTRERNALWTRYCCWRLGRTDALEEGRYWLDRISFERRDASAIVVGQLGRRAPNLTFWVFWDLHRILERRPEGIFPDSIVVHGLARYLPTIRALEERIRDEEDLLPLWAHFIRWCECWETLGEVGQPKRPQFFGEILGSVLVLEFALDHTEQLVEEARRHPDAFEATLRLITLRRWAEAWILGVSPLPRTPVVQIPTTKADLEPLREYFSAPDKQIEDRFATTLRFDRTSGRCVPVEEGDAETPVTVPDVPIPGWQGSLPDRIARR